ncbi:hypothetical protein EJB05_53349 [Eragrostis curvula]|uniref:Replication protein A 70 kDa DNA-binding subunit B/D first OB fold domain-containing protein n=1 Tax=Eragrostis curvula TaxID=38414 RepID=A0A5J9SQC9_9POAL|nr:hypothetical protein EJB05_53349 [Eragrostis curvula]
MAAPAIWPRDSSASSSLTSFATPLPHCSCLWSPSTFLRSAQGCIGFVVLGLDLLVPLLPAVSLRVVHAMGGFGSSCSLFRFRSKRLFLCLARLSLLLRLLASSFRALKSAVGEQVYLQMAPPPPVPLRELTLKFRRGTILARVCRMWDYRGGKDDGDIRHVDLVLVDAEGTPMYAEIGADDVPTKKPLLSEGKVYKFERFIVASAKPSYRPFPMELMIYVTRYTKIEECSDPPVDIPICESDFTPVERVPVNNPAPEAAEPKPDPREITVAELTQLIPYEIPDEGFRLTVTIVRFNEKQNWWFPSCNRCSRTSLPCPEGYKCPTDNCTGYKFKYKICYIVSDGTAETEVIFFADIGRQLIGKDVKMLMGANRKDGAIPNEIASQIGQIYQITINVTERAYSGKPFSYDVRKIDHAFGRAPVIPRIQPVAAKSLSLKNESSSAKNVEGHKIVPSVAAEEQSPLHEQGTPPPTITTTSAHGLSKSSDKDQDLPKTRGTCRKLFKDPSPDDKEAADTDLNTDLDDDIEDDSL